MENKKYRNAVDIPMWGKKVKIALINKNLTITKLSEEIKICRVTVSSVINGRLISPLVQTKICDYLDITI